MKKIVVGLCFLLTGLMAQPVHSIQVTGKPGPDGLFAVYEQNRKQGTANYITVDLLLLSYSMLRKQDIHLVEQNTIMPAFTALVAELGKELTGKKDPISLANSDFMAVLQALLAGQENLAKTADAKKAQSELDLVLAAQGLAQSPLWGYSLDYSQFKPRGFYSKTPEQSRYFQAMRYASQVLFAVKASEATAIDASLADRLTGQAQQLAALIQKNDTLLSAYSTINDQLAFRMGPADDLVLDDLLLIAERMPESSENTRAQLFDLAAERGSKPRILANVVDRNKLEAGVKAEDVLTGWRLFPQRYAPDSAFFQDLVAPDSGAFTGTGTPFGLTSINGKPGKGFVSAYELMAALGSKEAREWLDASGDSEFTGYNSVTEAGRQELAHAAGLNGLHLSLLQDLYSTAQGDGSARLTSGLAFWTWQRYVNLLYSKQSMTMIGKGFSFEPERKKAAIEPAATVYKNLLLISQEYAGHSSEDIAALWQEFGKVLKRCVDLATKTRLQVSLSDEEIMYLNNLDKRLKGLTGGKDHPIVVDIHTEPNSRLVVEQATGLPTIVWQEKARGARMSHFEFKQPMQDRLTDEQWQKMLRKGERPKWK